MGYTHPDVSLSTSAALKELENLTNPEIDRVAAIPNIVFTVLEVAKSVAVLEGEVARLKERNTLLRLQLHNSHLGRTEALLIPAIVPQELRRAMPRTLNDLNVFNGKTVNTLILKVSTFQVLCISPSVRFSLNVKFTKPAEQCDAALGALGLEINGKAGAYAKRGIIAEELGVRLP
ncbi:uncharacterized protein DFL_007322 [Arthrobotrys flagrans]|uniref:Uncharacterized protein n=1 Tax=Arthrobotrys flagrans TaxID=97331 RepID=A0A436ZVP9_ARTFL|nr:hypothetical protein DFL_007322 [Arthrobotrys flagrans]